MEPRELAPSAEVALALEIARRMRPPMVSFVADLRTAVGYPTLSRQAVYAWEKGRVPVPAAVLLAAARVCGTSADGLMDLVRSGRADGLLPSQTLRRLRISGGVVIEQDASIGSG